jgi:hypothetical protein
MKKGRRTAGVSANKRRQAVTVPTAITRATAAVIRVGDGRGFLFRARRRFGSGAYSVIVTAAHCLPRLPPAGMSSRPEERTYANLLGPLGEAPTAWCECLFVDPVADVAVLGEPDVGALPDEIKAHEAYEALLEGRPALQLTRATSESAGWLLTLDGSWERREIPFVGAVVQMDGPLPGGMSGSPLLSEAGRAVCVLSEQLGIEGKSPTTRGALLAAVLPAWLVVGKKRG